MAVAVVIIYVASHGRTTTLYFMCLVLYHICQYYTPCVYTGSVGCRLIAVPPPHTPHCVPARRYIITDNTASLPGLCNTTYYTVRDKITVTGPPLGPLSAHDKPRKYTVYRHCQAR